MKPKYWLAGLCLSALAGPCLAAPMSLACSLDQPQAPPWGGSFHLSILLGQAAGVALVDPESQHVVAMLHSSDVLFGAFAAGGDTASILWTRASSARAPLLGVIPRTLGKIARYLEGGTAHPA